jgi:glycosyltransferase involved in cell wall biosynthesis
MDWYPNREAVRFLAREVWPAVAGDDPAWRLDILGRHPPRALLALAKRDPRVEVPGFVPDVRPYLARAGIYVCPIRDGGGTRLKVLDALAAGKALVATGLAVEGIAVEPEVHFLRAETPAEFSAQVHRLAGDIALRAELGRQGRLLVERCYAWPVVGRSLLEAYHGARNPAGVG